MQDAGDFDVSEGAVPMTIARRAAANAALVAGLAAALAAEACAGADGPVEPSALTCPTAGVALCADPVQAAAVRAAVTDAATRIAPTLNDARVRTALVDGLTTLSAQLEAGDVSRARQTLAAVDAALTSARAASRGDAAADLDAIAAAVQETALTLAER